MKGIIDSTLREGAQSPGINFSLADRLAIAELLDHLGIEEIELGVATSHDPELPALLAACRSQGFKARLALWCRCLHSDIDHAAQLRPDILSLSIPTSVLHLHERLHKDLNWARQRLDEAIRQALALGIKQVSVGLEDATRADPDVLTQMCIIAEQAGAVRIRLADTVGIASPQTIQTLVRQVQAACSLEIGVHTHNDFGMATANSVAALEAGAEWADATVLGLGERAGNSRLEELAGYLSLATGRKNYQIRLLRPLCERVAQATGRTIPPQHPLIGSAIFTCESGLHLHGLTRNPATYEPYTPDQVGASRHLLIGRKIGKRALSDKLQSLGCQLDDQGMAKTLTWIRDQATATGRPLADQEIWNLAASQG